MNRSAFDSFVSAPAHVVLAVTLWALCPHEAQAQSACPPGAIQRLPPLTTTGSESLKPPLSSPAMPAISFGATSRKTASPDGIQLTSAVTEWNVVDAPRVRRLPPLTAVAPDRTNKPMRRPMAAHIGFQPPGSRPASGEASVLPGSDSVAYRTIILGPPPQPADATSSLANVGRATLRTPGLKPTMLPSPISRSPAH